MPNFFRTFCFHLGIVCFCNPMTCSGISRERPNLFSPHFQTLFKTLFWCQLRRHTSKQTNNGECSLDLHSLLATTATRLAEIRGRVICKKPSVLKQGYLQWMRRELVVLIDIGWSRQMFGALESFHTSNHRTSTGNDEARRNTAEFLHGRRWL